MKTEKHIFSAALCFGAFLVLPSVATASKDFTNLVNNAQVSGNFRLYNWDEKNRYQSTTDDNTFSLGGRLVAKSGNYYGFNAVFGFYTAHSLGLNNHVPSTPFPELVAPGGAAVNPTLAPNIDVLGKAYLQWGNSWATLRWGNQALDTPFANSADYRMIPVLYQGEKIELKPVEGVRFVAARIHEFKGWIDSSFKRTNSFIWNGIDENTDGFWLVGAEANKEYGNMGGNVQAWFYHFYDYANLGYISGVVDFNQDGSIKPFLGIQAAKEKDSGASILGRVDSTLIGGKVGASYKAFTATLSTIHIPRDANSYANGGLVSPYTNFYGSAPVFTQQTLYSSEAFGAGDAYQASVSWTVNPRLYAGLNFTYFAMGASNTAARARSNRISEWSGNISYSFKGKLEGLAITDIPSVASSPYGNSFLQNRLMLQYSF